MFIIGILTLVFGWYTIVYSNQNYETIRPSVYAIAQMVGLIATTIGLASILIEVLPRL